MSEAVAKFADEIIYPDSDGEPMSDNTKQFDWITNIVHNLRTQFRSDPNVFIAGDLLWYPVEGNNKIRRAPDAMVAFGRPRGPRGSYQQWLENDIAPQVVFEIRSPGNTNLEMEEKLTFYQTYEVEEYYLYDPDKGELKGWIRGGDQLFPVVPMHGWKSKRLGIRFELLNKELYLYHPDGSPFTSHAEATIFAEEANKMAEAQAKRANAEAQRAKVAEQHAKVAFSEGEQRKAIETARKMLADGLDYTIIIKYTGLSNEELATIKYNE